MEGSLKDSGEREGNSVAATGAPGLLLMPAASITDAAAHWQRHSDHHRLQVRSRGFRDLCIAAAMISVASQLSCTTPCCPQQRQRQRHCPGRPSSRTTNGTSLTATGTSTGELCPRSLAQCLASRDTTLRWCLRRLPLRTRLSLCSWRRDSSAAGGSRATVGSVSSAGSLSVRLRQDSLFGLGGTSASPAHLLPAARQVPRGGG